MRVALVFDHPYTIASSENVPHRRSFSAAVAAATIRGLERAGHTVDLMDLVADGWVMSSLGVTPATVPTVVSREPASARPFTAAVPEWTWRRDRAAR